MVLRFLPEHYRVVVCASRQCTEREEERKNEAAAKKANFAFVHFNANDPAPPRSTLTVNDGRGRRERERERGNGFMGRFSNEAVELRGEPTYRRARLTL